MKKKVKKGDILYCTETSSFYDNIIKGEYYTVEDINKEFIYIKDCGSMIFDVVYVYTIGISPGYVTVKEEGYNYLWDTFITKNELRKLKLDDVQKRG